MKLGGESLPFTADAGEFALHRLRAVTELVLEPRDLGELELLAQERPPCLEENIRHASSVPPKASGEGTSADASLALCGLERGELNLKLELLALRALATSSTAYR